MNRQSRPISIVVADDDADDRWMIADAFEENRLSNDVSFVEDGEQLLAYLRHEGEFSHLQGQPHPGLILLDLNMPKMDGREALREIKNDPRLCRIPVVVLTTSKAEEDILRTYDLGVNSFIAKPVSFEALVEIIRTLCSYWIEIVILPPECDAHIRGA